MLPYTSHITEEASFSSVTLFIAWIYDNQFSKIKFNLLKILEAFQEHVKVPLLVRNGLMNFQEDLLVSKHLSVNLFK